MTSNLELHVLLLKTRDDVKVAMRSIQERFGSTTSTPLSESQARRYEQNPSLRFMDLLVQAPDPSQSQSGTLARLQLPSLLPDQVLSHKLDPWYGCRLYVLLLHVAGYIAVAIKKTANESYSHRPESTRTAIGNYIMRQFKEYAVLPDCISKALIPTLVEILPKHHDPHQMLRHWYTIVDNVQRFQRDSGSRLPGWYWILLGQWLPLTGSPRPIDQDLRRRAIDHILQLTTHVADRPLQTYILVNHAMVHELGLTLAAWRARFRPDDGDQGPGEKLRINLIGRAVPLVDTQTSNTQRTGDDALCERPQRSERAVSSSDAQTSPKPQVNHVSSTGGLQRFERVVSSSATQTPDAQQTEPHTSNEGPQSSERVVASSATQTPDTQQPGPASSSEESKASDRPSRFKRMKSKIGLSGKKE